MHRTNVTSFAIAVSSVLAVSACGDQRAPTDATRAVNPTVALEKKGESGPKHAGAIVAHDSCDPATFNAALNNAEACVKHGQTTFPAFIAELTASKVVRDWRFTPEDVQGRFGIDILGNNVGGEAHTFTPVKQFGGGIVDALNQLSGNPVEALECTQLEEDDMVASGGKYMIEAEELAEVADGSGIARVQCCVHPWMRSEVHLR